jgi:hypothetical protein
VSKTAPLLRAPKLFDDEAGTELLVLHRKLLLDLGDSYVDMDSQALHEEITGRWGEPGIVAWNRVLAARLLASNDMAWEEWGVFEKVVAAVAGELPDFHFMQPPEAEDVGRALLTMAEFSDSPFHPDVIGYIGAACLHDNLWYLEAPLDVARSVVLEYSRDRELDLPFEGVANLLAAKSTPLPDPSSPAEVQFNEVLAVRGDLEAFRQSLMDQALKLQEPARG